MAIDVPTKANSSTAVLLKNETRTAVLCKQSRKSQKKQNKKKTQVLISGMAVFHQLWGDSNRGQESILVLLGQWFLIIYKEILAIQTTITSANWRNSCFPPAFRGQQFPTLCWDGIPS